MSTIVIQFLALVLAIIMLLPLLWTFSVSFREQRDFFEQPQALIPFIQFTPSSQNWERVLSDDLTSQALFNSLTVAIVSTIIAVTLGTITGYGLVNFRYRLSSHTLMFWLLSQRFIPPIVSAVPSFLLLREINQINTLLGLIVAHTTLVIPFAILIMRDYFAQHPRSWTEAAKADGASIAQVFRQIALPNAYPALVAAAMVCFVFSWNDLTFAIVLIPSRENATIPLALNFFQGRFNTDFGVLAAFSVLTIALPLLFSLFIRRYVFNALSLGIVQDTES
jgi:multiple sugar transport system permease protein